MSATTGSWLASSRYGYTAKSALAGLTSVVGRDLKFTLWLVRGWAYAMLAGVLPAPD
jgi:hypothetical protein